MFSFGEPDAILDGFDRLVICARIADSRLYKCILIFKLVMSVAGLLLLYYEYHKKKKLQCIIHPNVLIILNCIRAFCAMLLITYIVIHGNDLYRYSKTVIIITERMNKAYVFAVLRMFASVATVGILISLAILAVEQILSTLSLSDYENVARPRFILFITMSLTIIASCIAFCLMFTDTAFNADQIISSTANSRNGLGYRLFLIFDLSLAFIVFCLCIIIKAWNTHLFINVRRKILCSAQQRHQLSIKFQINENLKIAKLFIPISFFTFLLYVINIFGTWAANQFIRDTVLRLCVNELVFLHSWSAHVFALCGLYQMGELPFIHSYTVRNGSEIVTMESTKQFHDRQKAMFEGPSDLPLLTHVPHTSLWPFPWICTFQQSRTQSPSTVQSFRV
uniref:G-protein coupled receptors family 1 profile domain-containing protein n=1 Tax=Panagrellus redivivus TaxID=6233 RepID=A0A7E4UQ71_PANRE